MAQVTVYAADVSVSSSFQSWTKHLNGIVTQGYTTPSTGTGTAYFGAPSVPAGSVINSGYLTFTAGGSLYGGSAKVNGGGTGQTVTNIANAALTFKSNTGGAYPPVKIQQTNYANRGGTVKFSNLQIVVDYTPPTAPSVSGVTLGGSAATQYRGAGAGIALAFSAANGTNNNITEYVIQYSDNGGAWAAYSEVSGAYTVYAHPTAGNYRRFRVTAVAPYGNSEPAYSPYLYTYSGVSAPTSVNVTPTTRYTGETVTVSWSGASGGTGVGISRYEVYCNDVLVGSTTAQSLVVAVPNIAGSAVYKVKTIGTVAGYDSGLSSASATVAVENPRSTGVLNKSSVSMDDSSTIAITVTPSNAAYNHKVIWYTPSHTVTHSLDVGVTSDTLDPVPLAWCTGYPNATSGTANAKLETYNGATKIGELTYSFTVVVPATVLPTVSSLSIELVDGYAGMYLKGISKARLTATADGAQGSTILSSNYAMTGGGNTGNTNPWITPTLVAVGVNDVSVTVTDSRGRTATRTENITVVDYTNPTISLVLAERCLFDGTADNDGTYAKVKATLAVTSLSGNNPIALAKTEYRKSGTTTWSVGTNLLVSDTYSTIGGGNVAIPDAYEIRISLTDTVGKSSTYITTILPSTRLYDFRNDRASIGRVAGAIPKQLVLPDDWTTNIKHGNIDGSGKVGTTDGLLLGTGTGGVIEAKTVAALKAILLDLTHPVGSVFESLDSTSPATLFGGTWAAIGAGTFLVAAGTDYEAGSTGGEAKHALTEAENGPHTHSVYGRADRYQGSGGAFRELGTPGENSHLGATLSSGSGTAHENRPPYYAVYMWRRTA